MDSASRSTGTSGPARKANAPQRVLVTGSAGAIGQAVCVELAARGHEVRGFDRRPSPAIADCVVAELTDRAAVDHAMRDVQSVAHLAAMPTDRPFIDELLGPNVAGLFNVMDASRNLGVRRVVLASSCQAVSGLAKKGEPLPPEHRTAPTNHYGLTKVWAEQMGEMYARQYGMSVIAARIGWLPRAAREVENVPDDSLLHDLYLSPGDAGRFFACALEAGDVDFAVLYAIGPGRPGRPAYDVEAVRSLIGFEPQDRWPAGFHLPATASASG